MHDMVSNGTLYWFNLIKIKEELSNCAFRRHLFKSLFIIIIYIILKMANQENGQECFNKLNNLDKISKDKSNDKA